MSSERVTSAEILEALRVRHGCHAGSGQWVCIEEAFSGFATMGGGVDLLAIGAWRSAKASGLPGAGRGDATNPIVAYEVKVSRADFRRELYGVKPRVFERKRFDGSVYEHVDHRRARPGWPDKAAGALERSHYFMFAVPAGLLEPDEIEQRERPDEGTGLWIPPEAGLLEVGGTGCRVVHPAPQRSAPDLLGRHATAELIRHAVDPNANRLLRDRVAYLESRCLALDRELAEYERQAA